jgi:hypothetical protein
VCRLSGYNLVMTELDRLLAAYFGLMVATMMMGDAGIRAMRHKRFSLFDMLLFTTGLGLMTACLVAIVRFIRL